MTNIIPFPGNAFPASGMAGEPGALAPRRYEFTAEELAGLCRWYSAMKYAFPSLEGVMSVCHKRRFAAIGLYGAGGGTPSCLLSKHDEAEGAYFLWRTDQDPPRRLRRLGEITDAQIGAIAPPRNEARWLDLIGWMAIVRNPVFGSRLYAI
jgi:hypothetical protein